MCERSSASLRVLDLHNEDVFVTSGHPDQASLLSGAAQGPRFSFDVEVRMGFRIKGGSGCNASLLFFNFCGVLVFIFHNTAEN